MVASIAIGKARQRSPEKKRAVFRLEGTGKEATGKKVRIVELETRMSDGFLLVANSTS
jgi:hypothetical protein